MEFKQSGTVYHNYAK